MQNPVTRNNHLLLLSVASLPDRLTPHRPPQLLSTFHMDEYAVELIIDPESLVQADLRTTVDAFLSLSTDRAQPSEPEPSDIVREDYGNAPILQIEQSCHLSSLQPDPNLCRHIECHFEGWQSLSSSFKSLNKMQRLRTVRNILLATSAPHGQANTSGTSTELSR